MTARGPVVEVVGGRRFRRALDQCAVDVAELKAAHQRAGAVVVGAAVPRAPKRSGKLAAGHRASRAKATARVTVAAVYGGPVHWGWPARHIPANPWLYDAAVASEPVWLPMYEADVRAIIAKFDREAS